MNNQRENRVTLCVFWFPFDPEIFKNRWFDNCTKVKTMWNDKEPQLTLGYCISEQRTAEIAEVYF